MSVELLRNIDTLPTISRFKFGVRKMDPVHQRTIEPEFPVRRTVFACLLFGVVIALLRFPFTLDDAYITFTYVRHYAHGLTLGTWNVGEAPVEGFTSLLWTLLLGWGEKFGLSPFYLSKAIGFVCAAAMPLAALGAWSASNKEEGDFAVRPSLFAGAAIVLSLYVPLFFYSVTGMETTFFSLQVLLLLLLPVFGSSWKKTAAAMLLSVTLTLTRPEGILLVFLVQAYVLGTHWKRPPAWAVAGLCCGVLTMLLLTYYRMHVFHVALPNTYYAKASGGSTVHRLLLGLRYILRFLLMVGPAVIGLAYLLFSARSEVRRDRYVLGLLGLVLLYTVYVVKVGGDPDSAFPLRRHFVHLAGVLALSLGGVIALATRDLRQACRTALAIAVALAVWISIGWCRQNFAESRDMVGQSGWLHLEPRKPLWLWFDRYSSPSTLTAVLGAGEWPYEVQGRYIDMLGLNDSHIARLGQVDAKSPMQDSKTDMRYVLNRRPDIVQGYMEASALLHGDCPANLHRNREKMMHDLVLNPSFQKDYVFVVNGPYDLQDQAIFFRRAYAQALHSNELKTTPVSDLVLYTKPCF